MRRYILEQSSNIIPIAETVMKEYKHKNLTAVRLQFYHWYYNITY